MHPLPCHSRACQAGQTPSRQIPRTERGLAGGDDIIIGFGLLKHQPHGLYIISGKAPVTLGIQVSEVKAGLKSKLNFGCRAGDFAGLRTSRHDGRLMIEENAVAGKHVVAFTVIHGNVKCVSLGTCIG